MSDSIIDGIDYGPLAELAGVWKGDTGMDVAPEPDDDEHNPYYETLIITAAGDVTNAEQQTLSLLRYHQEVRRKSNHRVFHDQVGYWLWDPASERVVQTLMIPRGVALLAEGSAAVDGGVLRIEVQAAADSPWGILESPFMREQARTTGFSYRLELSGDTLIYEQTTVLDIYGKRDYQHTDRNTLWRHVG